MKKRKLLILSVVMSLIISFFVQLNDTGAFNDEEGFYVYDENERLEYVSSIDPSQSLLSTIINPIAKLFSFGDGSELQTSSFDPLNVDPNIYGIVRFKPVSNSTYKYTELDSGREGYFSPNSAADAAFIRMDGDFVICKLAGVVMKISSAYVESIIALKDAGNNYSRYTTTPEGRMIHTFSYYSSGNVTTSSTRVGPKQSYINQDVVYYSYDGHYFYDNFNIMIDDYRAGHYNNAVNVSNPYYNYYQYLSLRSTANYNASYYDDYIKGVVGAVPSAMLETGTEFIAAQNQYYINATLGFGIAVNETGYGKSGYARERNNLFGIAAYDSNPDNATQFSSTQDCINQWASYYMQQRYLNPIDPNSVYRGPHLGDKQSGINVKWASDPYWCEKAAAQQYRIDNLTPDYGRYTIGISNDPHIRFYKEANTTQLLYTCEPKGAKDSLYNYPMIVLGSIVDSLGEKWYKIQSDIPLTADRNSLDSTGRYDPARDYVYAQASKIDIVFQGSEQTALSDNDIFVSLNLNNVDNFITGFSVNSDISTFIENVKSLSPATTVTYKNKDDAGITSGIISTSQTFNFTTNGIVSPSFTVVVRGDVNGDGVIDARDYNRVKNHILGKLTLTGPSFLAAKADRTTDETLDARHYNRIKNHILGKLTITQ